MGFAATSLREIGRRAGVPQQLISHHFETKLGLWKAVADRIFADLASVLGDRMRGLEGVGDPERVRLLLREYIRFSAERPSVARFMMHEGANHGPRLEWLVERHVRPLFTAMQTRIAEAQKRGLVPDGDPTHIAYLVTGATVLFAQAAEFEVLTGLDAKSPKVVDTHVDLVMRLLLPGANNGPET
jgi:AcrR family transcriptional regulator